MRKLMITFVLSMLLFMPSYGQSVVDKQRNLVDSLISISQPNAAMALIDKIQHEAFINGDNQTFFRAIKQLIEASRLTMRDSKSGVVEHLDSVVKLRDKAIHTPLLCSILADYIADDEQMDDVSAKQLYDMAIESCGHLDEVLMKDYAFLMSEGQEMLMDRATMDYFIILKVANFYAQNVDQMRVKADYNPLLLLSTNEFVGQDIEAFEMEDYVSKVLLLCQRLESYDDEYLRTFGLMFRMEFVSEYLGDIMPKEDYLLALDRAYSECGDRQACAEILLIKSQSLRQWGDNYGVNQNGNDCYDFLTRAADGCKTIIDNYRDTNSFKRAEELLANINQPELYLSFDAVIPIKSQYSFAEVMMKNVDSVHIVIINSNSKEFYQNIKESAYKLKCNDKLPIERVVAINDSCGDKRFHKVRVRLPELKTGYYMLAIQKDSIFRCSPLYVSNLDYVSKEVNETAKIQIIDRNSGRAIKGANVNIIDIDGKNICTLVSDKKGEVIVPDKAKSDIGNNKRRIVIISKGHDTLLSVYTLYKKNPYKEKKTLFCDIITDRKSYRQGDSIRYKIIVREGIINEWEVKPRHRTAVALRDSDYNVVVNDTLTTNEFGSASSLFLIPKGMRNGMFQIKTNEGYTYINVEDFKLPTFEVNLTQTKESYSAGDSVRIEGKAISYAGFPISNSKVKYSVSLSNIMPYIKNIHISDDGIHGETTTDVNGCFQISYQTSNRDIRSIYMVEAFVTDISGETQSGKVRTIVGYNADKTENEESKELPHFKVELKDKICRVGTVANVMVSSRFKNAIAYYTVFRDKTLISGSLQLNNSTEIITIPINESLRGGVSVNITMVYKNRLYFDNVNIGVPFDNKELTITSKTIRDKVSPNSTENWTISVAGNVLDNNVLHDIRKQSKDTISYVSIPIKDCELAVTMYDSALDILGPYYWNINTYDANRYSSYMWSSGNYSRLIYDYILYGSNYYQYLTMKPIYYNFIPPLYRGNIYFKSNTTRGTPMLAVANAEMATAVDAETIEEQSLQIERAKVIQPRSNFRHTAIFYPSLRSDSLGNFTINFTIPDAITRWRLLALAHTKDFKIGSFSKDIESLRELMIVANVPRFMRSGDRIDFTARVTNLTEETIKAVANLLITDTKTNDTIINKKQELILNPNSNGPISWNIDVPNIDEIRCLIAIESNNHYDGEIAVITILPSSMQITTSQTITDLEWKKIKEGKRLKIAANDKTNYSTIEITSNPIWLVVQAIPSMVSKDSGSALKLLDNYSAITIIEEILKNNPQIESMSQIWNSEGNEYLSSIIFDDTSTKNIIKQLLTDIIAKQSEKGGWSWFDGMQDNLFITCKMLSRIGKLKMVVREELSVINNTALKQEYQTMINNAITFIDNEIAKGKHILLGHNEIEYLYAKSFFSMQKDLNDNNITNSKLIDTIITLCESSWTKQSIENQAKIALVLHRFGKRESAKLIIDSFNDRVSSSDQTSVLTLAYDSAREIDGESSFTNNLIKWLIANKQTTDWGTTIATAEACFAILSNVIGEGNREGSIDLHSKPIPIIVECNNKILLNAQIDKSESGTGYIKKEIDTEGNSMIMYENEDLTKLNNQINPIINIYHQYPVNIADIKKNNNGINIDYSISTQDQNISNVEHANIGDIVKVKITFTIDREMSYIAITNHLSAALEPTIPQSGYEHFRNFGAYISKEGNKIKCYIEKLSSGTYTVEYYLKATQCGLFSNGFTEIECQYAPQFRGNTNSSKIEISR